MNIWWVIVLIYVVALGLLVYILWIRGKNRPSRPASDDREEIEYLRKCQKKHKK